MTEEFMHYLWKFKLAGVNHELTSGEPLLIMDPGSHNRDGGPDFFNARVRIGGTIWAGNVELHIRSSDWARHGHQHDDAYGNVILHVVYMDDAKVTDRHGNPFPTLALNGKVNAHTFGIYQQLMINRSWIPCAHLVSGVSRMVMTNWLDRMVAGRFDRKAQEIEGLLKTNNNDWAGAFYLHLARSFGFKVNAVPFDLLARYTPLKIIRKHRENLFQLEALLFGQAGMLSLPHRSRYFLSLKKEYTFLKGKYNLYAVEPHLWKYLRMRPLNFPTLRIAQFAALLHRSDSLFGDILGLESPDAVLELLQARPSDYWNGHYSFKSRSPITEKKLGTHSCHSVIINSVVPFLYTFGKRKNKPAVVERSLKFLDQLPAESNSIVDRWKELGVSARSAYISQALIELKSRCCARKRCLECAIGNVLMRGEAIHGD